jgi:alpha-D-ribose 1-methylphosphonate 5-triphosphate synthase subunit PhnI
MTYVAIRGGEAAIEGAAEALEALRTAAGGRSLGSVAVQSQLRFLHGRVLGEGGVYHPELAALAIEQSLGDPLEAAFYLRAWRSTRPRRPATVRHDGAAMRVIRRVSAAFKDVPGGQMLGPTTDYAQRLFRYELLDEDPAAFDAAVAARLPPAVVARQPTSLPKVLDALRAEGLVPPAAPEGADAPEPFDVTRAPLVFPASRSAALQTMARGETGGLLAIAYSNMRGYGDVHPTVAELRVGYLPVLLPHPVTGELQEAGEVLMTECEIVAMYAAAEGGGKPVFGLGYGAAFGHNEVKAIAMAILDRAMQNGAAGPRNPSEDQEFVLSHVDGIESMGFCVHYKMPHYVTFQSDLDRLRTTRRKAGEAAP